MSEALVAGRGVARAFRAGAEVRNAVVNADFEVAEGQTIVLQGSSGSGKSTLLHLIAGLDTPTSGVLSWPAFGSRIDLRPGPVAVAFQGPSLLPPLTVKENVALPLLLQKERETVALEVAAAMLDQLQLTAVADHLPEELSGGQQQRAGLARALTGRPRLVLVDEPTGQQDRVTGRVMIDVLLANVKSTRAATLVATHDQSVAERFPLRWSMNDGRLMTEVVARSA